MEQRMNTANQSIEELEQTYLKRDAYSALTFALMLIAIVMYSLADNYFSSNTIIKGVSALSLLLSVLVFLFLAIRQYKTIFSSAKRFGKKWFSHNYKDEFNQHTYMQGHRYGYIAGFVSLFGMLVLPIGYPDALSGFDYKLGMTGALAIMMLTFSVTIIRLLSFEK
jgi:hypothetical protein